MKTTCFYMVCHACSSASVHTPPHLAVLALRSSHVGLPSVPGPHLLLPPRDLCICCSLFLGYTWPHSLIVNLCILQNSAKSTTSSRKPSLTSYSIGASKRLVPLFLLLSSCLFTLISAVTITASARLSEAMSISVHFPVSSDQHNEYLWNE